GQSRWLHHSRPALAGWTGRLRRTVASNQTNLARPGGLRVRTWTSNISTVGGSVLLVRWSADSVQRDSRAGDDRGEFRVLRPHVSDQRRRVLYGASVVRRILRVGCRGGDGQLEIAVSCDGWTYRLHALHESGGRKHSDPAEHQIRCRVRGPAVDGHGFRR